MMNKKQMIDILEALDVGDPVEQQFIEHRKIAEWEPTAQNSAPNFACFRYRRKPAPIEYWINVYPDGITAAVHKTEQKAIELAGNNAVRTAVHMREVIENE